MVEAADLRRRAQELEAQAQRRQQEAEAKAKVEAEATGRLAELADRAFRQPLDDVWREITMALPGCATWHRRVQAAVETFDREAEPLRQQAGMARGSAFQVDRLLPAHPVAPLLPWLTLFASGGTGETEPTPPEAR